MNADSRPVVGIVSGDPGGASALAPVIRQLIDDQLVTVKPLAYHQASRVWASSNLPYEELAEDFSDVSAEQYLADLNPALLVTGTSINDLELEKLFISAAANQKVPSLAVLDFWSSYRHRFADAEGALSYLPDKIAIIDQLAFDQMTAVGFPPEKLIITGQPAFDQLSILRAEFNGKEIKTTREALDVSQDELLVAFFSQPFSELFGSDSSNPHFPGFDEHSVLRDLIEALEQITITEKASIHLTIGPHLRETPGKFTNLTSDRIKISVQETGDPRELIIASDLVTGMTSTKLFESCCLGKITISLQPGLVGEDQLFFTQQGYAVGIYRQIEVKSKLAKYLLDQEYRQMQFSQLDQLVPIEDAADRLTTLVYSMLGDQFEPPDRNAILAGAQRRTG